ncbi:hypothetical protein PG987_005122 [Apiospora arundinis]
MDETNPQRPKQQPRVWLHPLPPFDANDTLSQDSQGNGGGIFVQASPLCPRPSATGYLCSREGWDLGAVIDMPRDRSKGGDPDTVEEPESWHPDTVEVCEIRALFRLLKRQKALAPAKRKLRAWVVSMTQDRFRALEVYVDQDVDVHEFHISILGECAWSGDDRILPGKQLWGDDKELKWLLSWILAQPLD